MADLGPRNPELQSTRTESKSGQSKGRLPCRSSSLSSDFADRDQPQQEADASAREARNACAGRWVMLVLYGALAIVDHINWISFWPITKRGQHFFGVSPMAVFMLSMLYVIVFILVAPTSGQLVDRRGLRFGVLAGAFLNFFGSLIKVVPAPFQMNGTVGYIFTFFGHLVGGVAHSFVLILPPKLAQNWFPRSSRVTAQASCVGFNQLGVTIGIFLSPVISDSDDRIALLLLLQFIGSMLILIVELIFFKGQPAVPPSRSATQLPREVLGRGVCPTIKEVFNVGALQRTIAALFRIPGYGLTVLSFGVGVGGYYAMWVVLSLHDLMSNVEFLSTSALLIYNFVGVLGALTAGLLIDRSIMSHRFVALGAYGGFAASLLLFSLCLLSKNDSAVAMSCALMGIFGSALSPTTIDLLMEVTFPAPQVIATAVAFVVGHLWGLIFIWGNIEMQHLQYYAPGLFLAVTAALAFPCFATADNQECRRRDYELRAAQGGIRGQLGSGVVEILDHNFFVVASENNGQDDENLPSSLSRYSRSIEANGQQA